MHARTQVRLPRPRAVRPASFGASAPYRAAHSVLLLCTALPRSAAPCCASIHYFVPRFAASGLAPLRSPYPKWLFCNFGGTLAHSFFYQDRLSGAISPSRTAASAATLFSMHWSRGTLTFAHPCLHTYSRTCLHTCLHTCPCVWLCACLPHRYTCLHALLTQDIWPI